MKINASIVKPAGFLCCLFSLAILMAQHLAFAQATVWTGPNFTFIEPDTDPTAPADQDRLTSDVWLTRGGIMGLFNEAQETTYTKYVSPVNTEWAYGTLASYSSLHYTDWQDLSGSNPPSMVGKPAVLYLVSDNIYLSIEFTRWDSQGGTFAYVRSTAPVPEPATYELLMLGGGLIFLARRKRAVKFGSKF